MTWAIKEHDMCEIFMQHPRMAAHTYYSQYTEKETETTRRLKEQEKEADRLRCTPIPTLPFPPPPDPYQYNSHSTQSALFDKENNVDIKRGYMCTKG